MSFIIVPLLAMAAIVIASPLNSMSSEAPAAAPTPAITASPTLPLRRRDGPSVTSIPVSSCIVFQDPSNTGNQGCYCSGYDSLLPFSTSGSDNCAYTEVVTATDTSVNGYPFTKTESNSAIVAYATTTIYAGGGDWYGAGDSTVLQAGTALSLYMDPTSYANVGTVTASGSALFTSVSSAIASACPPPSSGSTITQCPAKATVSSLDYVDEDSWHHDGELIIDIPIISVSDADVLNALITFIAAGVQSNSQSPNNTNHVSALCDEANLPCEDYENAWQIDLVNVPAVMQGIYTEQTSDTDGKIVEQLMEVSMKMKAGPSDYACSDVGLALSIMAAVGAAIPGLGWLGGGVVGSVGRAGLSLACNLEDNL